jgi:demethylmenaquinone methyltransferase/2-methoxy-6-polyprenyl-1,4-benzoquinol methylase
MLVAAHEKVTHRQAPSLLFESDALRLPIRDSSLDLITVAFGFRNLANYEDGLREMRRVLRTGGMAAILEFSQPPNAAFGAVYGFYSRRVLPWIGGLLTGSRDAYRYLPESIRKFPAAPELADDMRRAGFTSVTFERFTGGSVAFWPPSPSMWRCGCTAARPFAWMAMKSSAWEWPRRTGWACCAPWGRIPSIRRSSISY